MNVGTAQAMGCFAQEAMSVINVKGICITTLQILCRLYILYCKS